MFFRFLFVLPALFAQTSFVSAQVISIAQARKMPAGSSVTVRGIVTTGAELGRMRYMQDGTAGIAVFPASGSLPGFERSAQAGDSVEVTGPLTIYKGLLEISPVTTYRIVLRNRALPQPKHIGIADLGEAYEGQRVQIDSLYFSDTRSTFYMDDGFEVTDKKGAKGWVFIQKNSALIGSPIPIHPFPLVAIVSKYEKYQLLPLNLKDYLTQAIQLDSDTVSTTLRIKNCDVGKMTVKDAAGKEWLFTLAHSSGTTQLDVAELPAGSYFVIVRTHGQVLSLPFQKI